LIQSARLPLIIIQLFAQSTGEALNCFARLEQLLHIPEAHQSLSSVEQDNATSSSTNQEPYVCAIHMTLKPGVGGEVEEGPSSTPLPIDEFVLNDVNFECKAGQLCCIVGGVGQGKSTLALSLIKGKKE
jgi:ABC-type multidrug transport system fused ATPase/permease subunit